MRDPTKSLRFAAQGFLDVILEADTRLGVAGAEQKEAHAALQRARDLKMRARLPDLIDAIRAENPAAHNFKLAARQNDRMHALLAASRDAAAGALLQLAKEVLTVQYGGLANAPLGRKIGSVAIRELIHAGRNQSVHWDAELPHKKVQQVFSLLAQEQGVAFDLAQGVPRSRAYECLQLLGWLGYEQYERDLVDLINA